MDAAAFDRLTQTLVRATSRRAALGALLTTAGATLGLAGIQRATAQGECTVNGERCQLDEQCCSGLCKRRNNGKKVCMRTDNQGVCTIEENSCAGSSIGCGTDSGGDICNCYVTTTGQSFCGHSLLGGTCGCTSNKQCQQQAGKGAKCVSTGDSCPVCGGGSNICVIPCPTLDS